MSKPDKLSNTRDFIEKTAMRIIDAVISIPKLSRHDVRKDWLTPPPLSEFQHLEPWGWGLTDESKWIFNPKDCTPHVLWPIDTGVICDRGGEDKTLTIIRMRSITAREARGYASRFSPHMVRSDFAREDRGSLVTATGIEAWLSNTWVQAQRRVQWTNDIPVQTGDTLENDAKYESMQPSLMIAVALKHRYEWAVSVGLEDSLSVRFETDPTGIKDIFRIRDLAPGADRREALMTWVSSHWRQDRRDEEVEIYVRKHLRGAVSFSWRGMRANILPSPYDMEHRDKLKIERQRMHQEGTDWRLKNETR